MSQVITSETAAMTSARALGMDSIGFCAYVHIHGKCALWDLCKHIRFFIIVLACLLGVYSYSLEALARGFVFGYYTIEH